MILQSNKYYILASSQLFPFRESVLSDINNSDEALKFAIDAYNLVVENKISEALLIYNKAILAFPELPFFYACRSILHQFSGDDESAFYDYQIAKRLDFNYHHYLEWLENKGDMVESDELIELNATLNQQSDNAQLFINRAMLQVQHFNYDEAISDYSSAFILNSDVNILISRAAIYMYLLKYDKALADLDLVIESQPNVESYLYRAKLFIAIKEFDMALNDFDQAILLDGENVNIYEERAQLYEQIEQFDKAIADYSTIITSNSQDFYAYVLRGDVYEKTENWTKAIADYSEAIRLNPYYSDLYQYRGTLLEKIGETSLAKADFEKFEELEDED